MPRLTPNEVETIRRWAVDPTIYTPSMSSHRELLDRFMESLRVPKVGDFCIHHGTYACPFHPTR